MNIDEYLVEQGQAITDKLVEAIAKDETIISTYSLSPEAIRDNLPNICETIVEAIANNNQALLGVNENARGYKHAETRFAQDFEPEEIVREFFLLKQIIIAELKPNLVEKSVTEVPQLFSIGRRNH